MESADGWPWLLRASTLSNTTQGGTLHGGPSPHRVHELLPWCTQTPPPQHVIFHLAHALFLLAYAAPNSRGGVLMLHTLLIVGFLVYSTWAWNVVCARDVFSWGFAFAFLNLGQTLHVLYRARPVKTDRELEALYRDLFQPLNVSRLVFKRLVATECCHVSTLHAGEAYALQGLTKTDRLGLLLSGEAHVVSGEQFLHTIGPMQFLDSPEFESSRAAMNDKFKVSILADTSSRYLFWRRSSLEYLFMKDAHLATSLSTLVARDIATKLYSMNSAIVTERGTHLDVRLPSLTSSLSPSLPLSLEGAGKGAWLYRPLLPTILQEHSEGSPLVFSEPPAEGMVTGGGYGAPLGYSNCAKELLSGGAGRGSFPNAGMPPPNKMEHPLH